MLNSHVDEAVHTGAQPSPGRRASGRPTTVGVNRQELDWLVAHLQTVVVASPLAWAGKGMTLLQLAALHFIIAAAPLTLTGLAHALGTGAPATSALVDRLTSTGLVHQIPDPHDGRRVALSITHQAKPIIGEVDLHTAQRLHTVLHAMSPQAHRHLLDLLRDTIRRSAGTPKHLHTHR